ncbi:MAG: prenyltransferase/squalene oxidase repeat-containing protein [Candidatus Hermodarchaeota archaeon]
MVLIILFFTINAIPSVLGKTRRLYLIDFILDTEIEGFGFSNAIIDLDILDTDEKKEEAVSFEATAYALSILNDFGVDPKEIETLEGKLEDRITEMFASKQVNIYNLYYLLNSLNILQYTIDSSLSNRIYGFLNDTAQESGGFSFSNTTHLSTLSSTFYVIQLYSLIEQPIGNISVHKNWVLSCNNTDGGYGGNQTLSSTYLETCFAVFILDDERFGSVNDLVDINKTITYLTTFYVSNPVDLDNYGGYIPDELAEFALLTSTYYCAKAISLIDKNALNVHETRSWVLAHQNVEDGGFSENSASSQSKVSSVISSYYAFKTLEVIESLYYLNYDVWMVEFNYGILGIVIGSIGLVIVIAIVLWRRRRI